MKKFSTSAFALAFLSGGAAIAAEKAVIPTHTEVFEVKEPLTDKQWTETVEMVQAIVDKSSELIAPGKMEAQPNTRTLIVTSDDTTLVTLHYVLHMVDHTKVFQLQVPATEQGWGDAVKTVTAMLPKSGRVVSQAATSTLSVTADDTTLRSVEHYVDTINKAAGRQFSVELTVNENGEVHRFSGTARNGVILPVQSGEQIDFIKSITATDHGHSVETATLVVGLSATFTVKATDDGNIALHYALGRAKLNSLTNVAVDGGTIQLPDVSQDSSDEEVLMRNGATIDGRLPNNSDVSYTIKVSAI